MYYVMQWLQGLVHKNMMVVSMMSMVNEEKYTMLLCLVAWWWSFWAILLG